MKKVSISILLGLVCVLCSATAQAQKNKQDMVYLKNGSMLRGTLSQEAEAGTLKLTTADGSVWVFALSEVEKTEKVDYYQARKVFDVAEKGFYNASSLGILAGTDDFGTVIAASVSTVSGYKINPHYSVGLGVGIETFYPTLAPVFLEGRYTLLEGRFSPFLAIHAGYSIPLENQQNSEREWVNKGGVLANAELGIMNYLGSNLAITLSAGYRYQQSKVLENYWWFSEGDSGFTRYDYHRFVFRAGLLFN